MNNELLNIDTLIIAARNNFFCSFKVLSNENEIVVSCDEASISMINSEINITSEYPISLNVDSSKYVLVVDFILEGVEYSVSGFISKINNTIDSLVLTFSGPFRIGNLQRRLKERYLITNDLFSYVSLDDHKPELSCLELIDISESGISCYVPISQEMFVGKIFHESILELNLPNGSYFSTQLELRHFRLSKREGFNVCGFKFLELSPNSSLTIYNFISLLKNFINKD